MVNFPSLDRIRYYVFANGNVQVTIHQSHELGNHLRAESRALVIKEKANSKAHIIVSS